MEEETVNALEAAASLLEELGKKRWPAEAAQLIITESIAFSLFGILCHLKGVEAIIKKGK